MKIHQLTVLPDTPAELDKLQELAYNLYFSWNNEVIGLYKEMDEELWEECDSSPVRFLSEVDTKTMHEFTKNKAFMAKLDDLHASFKSYMNASTWYKETYGIQKKENMAYFSCEFGVDNSVPIYSGGLGVLSGDHIKTASDLGLPLVGVGLLYKSGYFKQRINQEGMQTEEFKQRNSFDMPLTPVLGSDGEQLVLSIDIAETKVYYTIWEMAVGRVKILLLDTNLPQNSDEIKIITNRLYDGDREIRIQQEYLLGIGGFRALRHLNYEIEMYHINEGHSAFLLLEHLRVLIEEKHMTFDMAKFMVAQSSLFTTHTPVPAGNERFTINLIDKYFKTMAKSLKISWELFLALGREFPENHNEEFCLTVLALKLCNTCNGVAQLHGEVSRRMWKSLYPAIPEEEIPICAITNGVHSQTWLDVSLKNMIHTQRNDKDIHQTLYDKNFFVNAKKLKDDKLWEWKQKSKKRLIEFARTQLERQYIKSNAGNKLIEQARDVLDEKALTIGFARRFATYKRGNLFLRDMHRLKNIVNNEKKPVQFIIAGKAHPSDNNGKDIIRDIHSKARELGIEHKIVFLEDYSINMAKYIVSGVDVWLNTPIKPHEASGTSGMKAGMNGALNLSITDGWWAEGFNNNIGWDLSVLSTTDNLEEQNNIESGMFYYLLEGEVTDLYFDRDEKGIPVKWVEMMKQSICDVGGDFNFVRTLKEYVERYQLIVEKTRQLKAEDYKLLHTFADWKHKTIQLWPFVEILHLDEMHKEKIKREDTLKINAKVKLGALVPKDVSVQCYVGEMNGNLIVNGKAFDMNVVAQDEEVFTYELEFHPYKGGKFGYTLRVFPKNDLMLNPFMLGLITWYEE